MTKDQRRWLREAQHGAADEESEEEMEQDPSVPFEHGMLLRPQAKAPPQAWLQNRAGEERHGPAQGLRTRRRTSCSVEESYDCPSSAVEDQQRQFNEPG